MHELVVLRAAVSAGFATQTIWSALGWRLVNSVDPICAWHTELALATTRVAALQILAEGCAAVGVDSAPPPELEVGFRVLLAETYTVSFESFAAQAELYLREQGALPEISALLGSVAGSLAAGETLYSVRERVLHQVRPFASLASTAWRQIVPHTPEELLDRVVDRATFLDFTSALASERAWADELETLPPANHREGALGWEATTIPDFLHGAVAAETAQGPGNERSGAPTWRALADFLYGGKIHE